MNTKNFYIFILFPASINLLCIALYFSGIKSAQQLMAPTIPWLAADSWREFGLLEQIQNFYLLATFLLLLRAAINHSMLLEKVLFSLASLVVLFLLLEEIDYGLHYYELIIGEHSEIAVRNWHNEETNNRQNISYLKKIAEIMMLIWFVILPLCKNKIDNAYIRLLIPSRWFIGTFFVALIMSKSAHFLNNSGFALIEGVQGNLHGNISEFKEANSYYLFLLYTLQLVKIKFTPNVTNQRTGIVE